MTSPASSIKAAKFYLFTALTAGLVADPADASLKLGVYYDEPPLTDLSDLVVIGDVVREIPVNAMVGGMGAWAFQDTYTIDVVASVFRGGDSARAVWERAVDLCEQIIAIQRADPTLGGAVILSQPVRVQNPACDWDEKHLGRVAEHTVTFFIRANY